MKLRIWIIFAALCLLSGSGWLLNEWLPERLPGMLPTALRSGLLTAGFWLVHRGTRRSNKNQLNSGTLGPLLGWSVLLTALPTVAIVHASEHISPLTETLVFTLVPVFVVFFASQSAIGFGAGESPLRLLTPALAGVAGAALLLPSHIPMSRVGQTWLGMLLAMAAVSAWAAIQMHRRLTDVPILMAAAAFSGSIFLLSAPFCLSQAGQSPAWGAPAVEIEVLRDVLFDGPVTLLTVWLLRELSPVAFSSRYVLVLAVGIGEGYLLLRPQTGWTTGLGMLLLVSSGAWLLFANSGEVSRDGQRIFRS